MLFFNETLVRLSTPLPPSRTDISSLTEGLTMTFTIARHRRSTAAVALPVVAGLLLTACGGGGSESGGAEPQSITFSYASANTTELAYENLAKDYMAAHPGVTIKANRVALNAYNSTLTTQV